MTTPRKIIVIGAGICGLSSAIWLRRAGHDVTLVDRDGPGAGASYGNAGLLAQWAMVPVNTPDLLVTGLKYLVNPNSPLFMQWGYLPRLAPWLARFVGNANPRDCRRMIDALIPMVTDSVDQHIALTRGTRAAKWVISSDFGYAYPSRKAFDADAFAWGIKREVGMIPTLHEGPQVQEAEPMLGPSVGCLAVLKGHGHIADPGAYMADLAEVLRDEGGHYLQRQIKDITLTDGRITGVETDQGPMACDHAVLAAGIWSKPLMRKLGIKLHLEAERGYHLHFVNPSQMPRHPLMISAGKFAVNPMATGLRCAGTVELGGIEKGPSAAPLKLIRSHVKKVFPGLSADHVEEWMGFRPSTPDSLPLVGELGGTGVFAAFGHQHVGLTAGPKTGRIIAGLIDGQRPNIDLTPYDANRFHASAR